MTLSDTNQAITTPDEVARKLAERSKKLRLMQGFKRQTLADRAGITHSSLKRFETTGRASLELVLKLVFALGRLDEFTALLKPPPARSLAEIEKRSIQTVPKRGKR